MNKMKVMLTAAMAAMTIGAFAGPKLPAMPKLPDPPKLPALPKPPAMPKIITPTKEMCEADLKIRQMQEMQECRQYSCECRQGVRHNDRRDEKRNDEKRKDNRRDDRRDNHRDAKRGRRSP